MALTACGSDDSGSDDSGTGSEGGGDAGPGKVGVILPDTESSVRWESADRPALQAAFDVPQRLAMAHQIQIGKWSG